MPKGFARVAAVSVPVRLGDVEANEKQILAAMEALRARGVQLAVFPELCLTGYTVGDLVQHELMQRRAWEAMFRLCGHTEDMAVVVGLPVSDGGRLYNCAAVLQGGQVRGLAPKTYLPNGNEFYETRWFASGADVEARILRDGADCALRPNMLFELGGFRFGVELCEDLWAPIPPSCQLAVEGADIIVNPSASNALVAKHQYRRELISQQSGRLYAGYVYAGAGFGESTSDMVFDGYTAVFENGRALSEGERFSLTGGMAVADIDIGRLRYQRQRNGSFHQMRRAPRAPELVPCGPAACAPLPLERPLDALPFVPCGAQAEERLEEIVKIQCMGLETRLRAIGLGKVVVGVSGGLDSTLALLIAVRAFDALGLSRQGVHALTMPGMGTGARTRSNAQKLMDALGVTSLEIPIGPAVRQHFQDIGQDESVHDVTYENSQARERTQILMDYANKVGGIVLGTGDLSEAALGFCTYNGDHMSMYNVNCSVPKTLVKSLVRYLSAHGFSDTVRDVCADVIDTPISPELLPVSDGELNQRTEEILGDYALNDFFLYHLMDSGASPEKLRMLAAQAFDGVYDAERVASQLRTFLKRFFAQQFKRNCVPDGPKVGSVSLSPRGDWRMPSEMSAAMWLQ
ncbi:MAG: NAD(+) synthase [Clostridiales bacterium]|nr:NAD(+) synthase [Clostridiales bacterium]MDO4350626.1 NAD(+) synthase [Eubacteriales bacterium]MDY4009147.1 NAD(+) synthase [Candidatus Limiplasma sp.]